ncbi:MAG: hypothetical protein PHG97_05040 [Candidatus Margulisbacteria bacterium]|nr:hypothetical protein [Candidatus Margulisiibacteriota bacterium]
MKKYKGIIIFCLLTFVLILSAAAKPRISIYINGVRALPGDPISANPVITVAVTTSDASVTGRITVDNTTTPLTFVGSANNFYATLEVTTALADGLHGLTVEAFGPAGTGSGATSEVVPLFVQTKQDLIVQGTPLCYPNPFDPGIPGGTVTIAYMLSKAAGVTLSIHDLTGAVISKMAFGAGSSGGRAGYNAVSWNGQSDAGSVAGNGIYILLIIGDGKVLAKGKLTVLKR